MCALYIPVDNFNQNKLTWCNEINPEKKFDQICINNMLIKLVIRGLVSSSSYSDLFIKGIYVWNRILWNSKY